MSLTYIAHWRARCGDNSSERFSEEENSFFFFFFTRVYQLCDIIRTFVSNLKFFV